MTDLKNQRLPELYEKLTDIVEDTDAILLKCETKTKSTQELQV